MNIKVEEEKFITCSKRKTFLMDEDIENEISKQMENKVNLNNAIAIFFSSKIFKISNLSKVSFSFIERLFPMVANSSNFLKLDFKSVAKILSSSELSIDSELEVYNAADGWLRYKLTERSNYAKDILLRIRLSLLSVPALNQISNKNSCFNTNDECASIIKEVLENKKDFRLSKPRTTGRYCNHNNFDIIICGGKHARTENLLYDVHSIKANNTNNVKELPKINKGREYPEMVSVKGKLYVLSGQDSEYKCVMPIEKYSPITKTWEIIADMYDDRTRFCACSFINNIYVIGGHVGDSINSCIKFNTNDHKWEEVARLEEARRDASCAVFEGKVVTSGGNNKNGKSNSVEAYDHITNLWSNMPNMVEERSEHKLVAIKDKLYVVGGGPIFTYTCEVFNSTSNKFVLIKPPPESCEMYIRWPVAVISIKSKIAIFNDNENSIVWYDVENDKWFIESCEVTRNLSGFCCAKLPHLLHTTEL